MDKIKRSETEQPREMVNQFIIECMFSKYFCECTDSRFRGNDKDVAADKEEIATPA